jgi:hypothetical protein
MVDEGASTSGVINLDDERKKRKTADQRASSTFIGTMKSIASFLVNEVWVWFTDSKGQPGVSGQVQSIGEGGRSVTVKTESGKIETVRVENFKPGQKIDFTSGQRKQN